MDGGCRQVAVAFDENKIVRYAAFVMVLTCGLCWAQAATECKPSTLNVPGAEYPCVYPDNWATFRLEAPEAESVQVSVGQRYDMTRDAEGVWSITTPPLVVGFHYYALVVDGVQVADPAAETFFGSGREMSGIEIPEKEVNCYDVDDVPHGEVRQRRYFSTVTNAWRRVFVYTPPGYDTNPEARYPVVYLYHGWGEDESGWVVQGRMDSIMDNLIAAKKAKPMIVVMENHLTALKPSEGPLRLGRRARGAPRPNFDSYGTTYTELMFTDLIPMLESDYRALTGSENRAMAGLSMGGMQTFQPTLQNLDKFAYIGGFSPGLSQATIDKFIFSNPEEFNKKVKLPWIATGTAERDDNPNILRFHEALEEAG